jgi:hypothetical protein
MTKHEIALMLGYFKTAYCNLFDDKSANATIELWYDMFCDEDATLVKTVMKKHVATNKYPPSISELLQLVEAEKWELYNKYIAYEHLSDDVLPELPLHLYPRDISRIPKHYQLQANKTLQDVIASPSKRPSLAHSTKQLR